MMSRGQLENNLFFHFSLEKQNVFMMSIEIPQKEIEEQKEQRVEIPLAEKNKRRT